MSIKITTPPNAFQDLLVSQLSQWVAVGQTLEGAAATELQAFVSDVAPLVESIIQAKLNGDPHADEDLATIAGAEGAVIARLALQGIQLSSAQARATINAVISTAVMFLKAAATGALQAAIPGSAVIAGAVGGVINAATNPAITTA